MSDHDSSDPLLEFIIWLGVYGTIAGILLARMI